MGAHAGWIEDLDLRGCEVVDRRLEGLGDRWRRWVGLNLAVDYGIISISRNISWINWSIGRIDRLTVWSLSLHWDRRAWLHEGRALVVGRQRPHGLCLSPRLAKRRLQAAQWPHSGCE